MKHLETSNLKDLLEVYRIPDETVVIPVQPRSMLLDVFFHINQTRLATLRIKSQIISAAAQRLNEVIVSQIHEEPLKPDQIVLAFKLKVLKAAAVEVLDEWCFDLSLRKLHITLVL